MDDPQTTKEICRVCGTHKVINPQTRMKIKVLKIMKNGANDRLCSILDLIVLDDS